MNERSAEGVLITGAYGSGKSSVAEEIACMLEQRGEPYALLDLDYLGWAGVGDEDRATEFALMLGCPDVPRVALGRRVTLAPGLHRISMRPPPALHTRRRSCTSSPVNAGTVRDERTSQCCTAGSR